MVPLPNLTLPTSPGEIYDNLAAYDIATLAAIERQAAKIIGELRLLQGAIRTHLAGRVRQQTIAGDYLITPGKAISRTGWRHTAIASELVTQALKRDTGLDARGACDLILAAASFSGWGQRMCASYGINADDYCLRKETRVVDIDKAPIVAPAGDTGPASGGAS